MQTRSTVWALLPLYFILTACPAPTAEIRPQLGHPGLGPRNLVFTPRDIGFSAPAKQPRPRRAMPLYAQSYTLLAGDEVIWRIERADPSPDRKCRERDLPIEIVYGEAPSCFRETMPAKPLQPGRSYRLQGENRLTIDFTYRDLIRQLSARGYAFRTRQWQREHP